MCNVFRNCAGLCFIPALADGWPAESADFSGLSCGLTPISRQHPFLLRPPADLALEVWAKEEKITLKHRFFIVKIWQAGLDFPFVEDLSFSESQSSSPKCSSLLLHSGMLVFGDKCSKS